MAMAMAMAMLYALSFAILSIRSAKSSSSSSCCRAQLYARKALISHLLHTRSSNTKTLTFNITSLFSSPIIFKREFLSMENIYSDEAAKAHEHDKENIEKSSDRSDDPSIEILEKGEIFFFYRPKVEREHPTSMDDVQRMYMVLKPEVGKRKEMVKQSHDSGKEGIMENSPDDHDKEQEKMHANLLKNRNQEHERDRIKVKGISKEEDVEKHEITHDDHDKEQEKLHASLPKNRNQEHGKDHIKVKGTSKEEDVENQELSDSSKSNKNDDERKTNKGEGMKKDYVHSEGDDRISSKEGCGHGHQKKQEGSIGHDKTSSDGVEHGKDSTLFKGREGGYGEEKVNIEKQQLFRFIILGRKSLPDASKRTRPYWGFVELVTMNLDDIKKALGPEDYSTATRGERHVPAARAAGEGRFCIVTHRKGKGNQSHTHLVYKLELPKPEKLNSPQAQLNIEGEGSFIIQVKNPTKPTPPNVGLGNKRKAMYPAYLQGAMGYYQFAPLNPCDFLNFEGCEFILISASDDLEKELGLHLDVQHDESCSALLHLFGKDHHGCHLYVKPLMEGEWA